jgi:hypothetical protein
MARAFKSDDYLAGLWSANLPRSLLWCTMSPAGPAQQYCAPCWSWASIEREIKCFPESKFDSPRQVVAKVLSCAVTANNSSFGPVTGGSRLMKGFVCEASALAVIRLRKCTCKDYICPRDVFGTVVVTCLDAGEDFSDTIQSPKNLFLFPIRIDHVPLRAMPQNTYGFVQGLVLEPVQTTKVRFHRVYFFQIGSQSVSLTLEFCLWSLRRFKDIPHIAVHALLLWIRGQGSNRIVGKGFTTAKLKERYYQDFDGVNQYTIEMCERGPRATQKI